MHTPEICRNAAATPPPLDALIDALPEEDKEAVVALAALWREAQRISPASPSILDIPTVSFS
ncbi:MAG: hypothetical protein LBU75_03915 [Desulfovibrio sp.]|jgi:DTW domain-containing protein YfiP|nr:hypothetical protein [Desulfovibrio sp.]